MKLENPGGFFFNTAGLRVRGAAMSGARPRRALSRAEPRDIFLQAKKWAIVFCWLYRRQAPIRRLFFSVREWGCAALTRLAPASIPGAPGAPGCVEG
ncbi:MAG: hypothetical protein GY859_21000 [Desulfobacterales bacterium]|nr:hypothetical protein [Desulfobacterales bacterium]